MTQRIPLACSPVHVLLGCSIGILMPLELSSGQDSTDPVMAQDEQPAEDDNEALEAPDQVDVRPLAADEDISVRLQEILEATRWFQASQVEVNQGVVFLSGETSTGEHRQWAGDLARNTESVVAVVNRIRVSKSPWWDLSPALSEIRSLGREAIQMTPLVGVSLLILATTVFVSIGTVSFCGRLIRQRLRSRLLESVLARSAAIPVALLGLYLALRVSGLTQVAATVVGGTGLFGLVLGIAFRDIAENFLASLLISIQRPFAMGDFIRIEGNEGIIRSVTSRGTLLMTVDGNHVQIPNAIVYKSIIENITANPNIRCDFVVGIDYADAVQDAQQTITKVLDDHFAVLGDPAPQVLVDELGASTVNLRVYFWLDGKTHSLLKVRSSVIQQTKLAIQQAGLSMPDEAREIIFPKGVPLLQPQEPIEQPSSPSSPGSAPKPAASPSQIDPSDAELKNDLEELERQADEARSPEQGENLLAG